MTNAFTQKPDLSKFIKDARHSAAASKNGQANSNKPKPQQRVWVTRLSPRRGKE